MKIKASGILLGFGTFYRPPILNAVDAINSLEKATTCILPVVDEIIIVGDLNKDLLIQPGGTVFLDNS